MADAGPCFNTNTENSENAQEKSLGTGSGAAAAGLVRRKGKRRRKGHRRWRSKKKQKFQTPEEFLTFEVGFLKVWWEEQYWKC